MKRRGHPNQIWSLEKLDNKLVDMRELYNEIQSGTMMQVRRPVCGTRTLGRVGRRVIRNDMGVQLALI